MGLNKLCLSCMEWSHTEKGCTRCHSKNSMLKNPSQMLPPGVILDGRYLIGRALGRGGFGCTYICYDLKEEKKAAIKEFMPMQPAGLASRAAGTIRIETNDREMFSSGEEDFLREAQLVHGFMHHPNIIHVTHLFREKETGTAYYVMEYLEGETLEQYRKSCGGRIDYSVLQLLILPVLDALECIHEKNVIHRDISPDNIFVGNMVKLLDFGAARVALANKSQSLSVILKKNFAPREQYHKNGNQGPWTDIYALSSTMYFCLTGTYVPPAPDRGLEKELDPIIDIRNFGLNLPESAAEAIMRALAARIEDRIQSAAEFRAVLLGEQDQMDPAVPPVDEPGGHTGSGGTQIETKNYPRVSLFAKLRSFFARLFGTGSNPGPRTLNPPMAGSEGRLVLYGVSGVYAGESIILDGMITIGRSASYCQLVYPPETAGISRLHCSFWIDQETGTARLRDEGATFGTYCNGRQLNRGETVELYIGDRISLGYSQDFEIRVC